MAGPASAVFKSICEEVLLPAGVKVGGYPDELFKDLSEAKREALGCQICFLVAKDALRCGNGHLFCSPCIYAWSLTSDDNADRCPVCRRRGCYRNDVSAAGELALMSVICPEAGCAWSGQLLALRSHDHGAAVAGADARNAGLPFVRSRAGDAVFPDFGNGADAFRATAEMERLRRRQRLARIHGHVLDGQARLAFLMSLFEEDLERRRGNLAAIANMQRRFHDQQFDQLIQLERELGAITTRLIQLVESATGAADRMNRTLNGGGVATIPSTNPDIATATSSPSVSTGVHAASLPTSASSVIAGNGTSASGTAMAAVASAAATTAAAAAAAATAASVLALGARSSDAERRTQLQPASAQTPSDSTGTLERLLARRDALANRLRSSGSSNAAPSAADAAVIAAAAAAAAASVSQQRYPRIASAAEAIRAAATPQRVSATGSGATSRSAALLGANIGGAVERVARDETSATNSRPETVTATGDSQPSGNSRRAATLIPAALATEQQHLSPLRPPHPPAAVATSISGSSADVVSHNPHVITYPPNRLQVTSGTVPTGTTLRQSNTLSSLASESASIAVSLERVQVSRSSPISDEREQRMQEPRRPPSSSRLIGATVSMPSGAVATVWSSPPRQPVSSAALPPAPRVLLGGDSGASGGVLSPGHRQRDDFVSGTVAAASVAALPAAAAVSPAAAAVSPAAAAVSPAAAAVSPAAPTPRELSPPRRQRFPAAESSAAAVSSRSESLRASNPQVIAYPANRSAALASWRSPPLPASGTTVSAAPFRLGRGRRSTTPDVESGRLGPQQLSPQRSTLLGPGAAASSQPASAATPGRSRPLPQGAAKTSSTQLGGTGGASGVGRGIQPNSVARSYCYL